MRRLLALVVAIGLVGGAVVVRGRLDRGEPLLTTDGSGGEATSAADGLTIVCARELAAACDGVEATVEVLGAREAAQSLAEGTLEADAWLAPAPWPDIAQVLGEGAEVGEPTVLARTPLVVVGFADSLAGLAADCGEDPPTWRCLGERSGLPRRDLGIPANGDLAVAHADPGRSDTGLLVLGVAVARFFGRTDLATFDLDDPDFAAWFDRLEDAAPPPSPSPVRDLRTQGLPFADVVATTAAEAAAATTDARFSSVQTGGQLAAVLVGLGGADPAPLAEPLREGLASLGWEPVRGGGGTPAGSDVPDDDDLPGAGFLLALEERWEEVTR